MDLMQLQYFRTIARLENLTKASELLYVAQPNLSVSISRLEAELGVSLFDRRRGRIRLSPTGRQFLETVDRVLDELDEGIAGVRALERHADEQVCVANGIVDLMGTLLRAFLAENADVSVRQLGCRNDEIPDCVLRGEADFGFLFGAVPQAGLEYMEVDRCERVVQLAASHPLAGRGIVSLAELDGQKLICNLARDDKALLGELARGAGFRPDVCYECDDNRVETSMTLCGGVSIAPVSNYLKLVNGGAEGLCCLRIRESVPEARLGLIRRQGGRLSAAGLRFCDMVDRFFRGERELAAAFARSLPAR